MFREKKRGVTIIEMMMAIFIFTMGIGGFSLLVSRVWNGNKYTMEMGQTSMAVSRGVNQMAGYIRSARQADDGSYPIQSIAGNDLVLFSNYDTDAATERLHFYKSGQDILLGITQPSESMPISYPPGDQQVVTLAERIVNDVDTPIFFYYDRAYAGVGDALVLPVDVSSIRLIKIYLHMNIDPNNAPDNIELQTFVGLRNLNDAEE